MTMGKYKSCLNIDGSLCPQGLIISYEGLANPILESQVLEHADELTRNGIRTEVWFLCGTSQLYNQSKDRLILLQPKHIANIRLLRSIWHNLPMSEYFNAIIINAYINKLDFAPNWIQARTEYVGAVCAALKNMRCFKFILDLRGDTLAEILLELNIRPFWDKMLLKLKLYFERRRRVIACKKADASIFVSKELQRFYAKEGFNVPYIIIPCVANPSLFYYDQFKRTNMRNIFGYSDTNIVLCYSGSTAVWQCANETIGMISGLMRNSSSVRGLIISREKEYFKNLVDYSLRDNFKFVSAEFDEVNDYLNSADFAVLLRQKHIVNYVASPVKFAEYSMAGLNVITTNAVEQVVAYGSLIGNITVSEYIGANLVDSLYVNEGVHRELVSLAAQKFYSRKSYIDECISFYMK